MKFISILSGNGFVMYNKEIAKSVSVNGAIIFGQLCSSYESFNKKGMLTKKDNKDYFFLTSDCIEEETSLTYKQQLKAIKELEKAEYIETKVMGVPAKKYFHVTEKILKDFLSNSNPSSDKREDLNISAVPDTNEQIDSSTSIDKRETLGMPKDITKSLQKGSTIKKKNKKEQYKENNNKYIDNYQETITKPLEPNEFKDLMINATNEFYTEFAIGRWSKKEWNTLVETFVDEIIEKDRYVNIPVEKMKGYAYKSLLNMVEHSDYKRTDEYAEYKAIIEKLNANDSSVSSSETFPFYNWLEG